VAESGKFYDDLQLGNKNDDRRMVQRQAYAGMLWSKQFYYYDVRHWINGDPAEPAPPTERLNGRNSKWMHLNTKDIFLCRISGNTPVCGLGPGLPLPAVGRRGYGFRKTTADTFGKGLVHAPQWPVTGL